MIAIILRDRRWDHSVNNLGIKNSSIIHIPGYKKTPKAVLEAGWLQLKALTVGTHTLLKYIYNKLITLICIILTIRIYHITHIFCAPPLVLYRCGIFYALLNGHSCKLRRSL